MVVRVYGLNVRNKATAIALGMAALVVGGTFLVFGLALLVSVGVIGLALGIGILLFRKVTGRGRSRIGTRASSRELDPANEVFPDERVDQRGIGGSSPHDFPPPREP